MTRYTASHWGIYEVERADTEDPVLKAFGPDPDPSPIGLAQLDASRASIRVRRPAVRSSWLKHGWGAHPERRGIDPYVEVPWATALDLAATALKDVIERRGNSSIFGGSYGWSSAGRFHHAQSQVHRFLNALGGYVRHADSYSLGAARVLMPHLVATMDQLMATHTSWGVLAEHTRLFVSFGGVPAKNAQISQGMVGHHQVSQGLRGMAEAGVRFVNVSPVDSDLDTGAPHEWIPIRPNSDTAMLLAIAHTLYTEGLHDAQFLATHCVGFEKFLPYLMGESDGTPKSAAWAAAICGIEANVIADLTRRMAKGRTMLAASWSLQRADHGEQTYWMAITLAAMLGQIGLPGGGIGFAYAGANGIGASGARIAPPSLPAPINPVKQFIPVARIADMLERPGQKFDYDGDTLKYPDARIVYWCGGNPFHHHQDLGRLVRAWQRPETIIAHEAWWNTHARHADILLPVTTTLERNDITGANQDTYALAMRKAIDPVGEARDDFEIFTGLAARLGFKDKYTDGLDEMGWIKRMYGQWRERAEKVGVAMPDFDAFWTKGHAELPDRSEGTVFLKKFRDDPVAHPLSTPSGKIEIFSENIASFAYDDCPGHPAWFEPAEWLGAAKAREFPLHMISNQPRTRLHSQYDNGGYSQASKIKGREPAWINPADAAKRGIADGDVIRVFNDRGACLAGAVVTDQVRVGVLQLATGAWYSPLPTTTAAAGGNALPFCAHGNPNVLTRDIGTSRLAQGSSAQTCLVEIEKWPGELPEVTVMIAPVIVSRA